MRSFLWLIVAVYGNTARPSGTMRFASRPDSLTRDVWHDRERPPVFIRPVVAGSPEASNELESRIGWIRGAIRQMRNVVPGDCVVVMTGDECRLLLASM